MANEMIMDVESPQGHRQVRVAPGVQIADALRVAGTPLNMRCGGRGLCDGCMVDLLRGSLIRLAANQMVAATEHPLAVRACAHAPAGEGVSIRIPQRSLLAYQPQVVTDFRVNVSRVNDPLWQQHAVDPGTPDQIAQSLAQKLDIDVHSVALASSQYLARGIGFQPMNQTENAIGWKPMPQGAPVFATLERQVNGWALVNISSQREENALAAAIDIGTTTVAVLLVDLADGKPVGRAAQFNRQMQLGDDVLTRIHLCIQDGKWLGELQKAVVADTIAPLLRDALAQANAAPDRLKCIVVAGNTTMLHLLAGVNPAPMGTAPFTPVFLDHRILRPGQIPSWPANLAPECVLHLLPGPAAYVGADLSAGMLASGLLYDDGPSLLVDVGTNGEIILKHNDHVAACATAAGPAFEGAGLASGVRAGDGAIGHLRLSASSVEIDIIGGSSKKPIGLCGSGYIDFLAEARRVGLLNEVGRFNPPAGSPLHQRLVNVDGAGRGFVVAHGMGQQPIVVSEADIARLLAAKAAIAAGVLTLLERRNLAPADVKRVYLAGGFGTHMSAAHAIACGLLPGFVTEQIQPVGNSALAGAYLAALDSTALTEIVHACRGMDIVELNLDPGFEIRYIEQLMMP